MIHQGHNVRVGTGHLRDPGELLNVEHGDAHPALDMDGELVVICGRGGILGEYGGIGDGQGHGHIHINKGQGG